MILLSDDFLITVLGKTIQERTKGIYKANLYLRTLVLQEVNYMKFIIPDINSYIDIFMKKVNMPDIIMKNLNLKGLRNDLTSVLYKNMDLYLTKIFNDDNIQDSICEKIEMSLKYNISSIIDALNDEEYFGYSEILLSEFRDNFNEKDSIFKFYSENIDFINDFLNTSEFVDDYIDIWDIFNQSFNKHTEYIDHIFSILNETDAFWANPEGAINYSMDDYYDNYFNDEYIGHFYNSIILNYILYKSNEDVNKFIYNFNEIDISNENKNREILILILNMC